MQLLDMKVGCRVVKIGFERAFFMNDGKAFYGAFTKVVHLEENCKETTFEKVVFTTIVCIMFSCP